MSLFEISNLPNPSRLHPRVPHTSQTLLDGMLLETQAVFTNFSGNQCTMLCEECRKHLTGERDTPPPLSLANGLWVGAQPIELSRLTLPEALLIGLVYPRVFICKLWPKSNSGVSPQALQNGLMGNVTSFEMNANDVGSMVDGKLMPRRPEILASLISITIVNKFPLPKNWLKGTFRVRRTAVRSALQWLKRHNPTYYGDITIDNARLEDLPEDDVPLSIASNVHLETNITVLDSENDTYVPTDPEEISVPTGVEAERHPTSPSGGEECRTFTFV